MFKDLFRNASLLDLPVWAMCGFFAVFVCVLIWTLSKRQTAHFDAVSRLPLDSD